MAVANQKGGVGKSTTAVSLGAALAETGHAVLVIDLDPQGNASTGLGIRHEAREVTVYDVLAADADIRDAIVETPVGNLFAIPSTIDLAGAEIELVSQFSREMRLQRALEPLRSGAFDFILLDCPPSLGLLTINALAAAEELLVPIQCEYYALEGLGQLLRNVRLVQQNVNPGLRLSGIVMTMFDPRTKLSEQVVDEVRKYFGDLVYDTIIPRTVRLSEAPGFGQPITVYDPRSRGAECYRDLAKEVAAREAPEGPMPVFEEMPTVVVEPVAPQPAPARSAPHPLRESVPDAPTPAPARAPDSPSAAVADTVPAPQAEHRDDPTRSALDDASAGRPVNDGSGAEVTASGAVPAEPKAGTSLDARSGVVDEDTTSQAGVRVEEPPRSEPTASDSGDSESEPLPEEDSRRVVVVDAYDLEPADTPPPEAEDGAAVHEDEDDGRRKRWSLFRRGGRR
jgi:chromosome partitioning protein